MTVKISISPEAEARLRSQAEAAGVDISTYVSRYLERLAHPCRSVVDLSGPVGEAFSVSGMTEDELSYFLEDEKHAMRKEQRAESAE